MSRHYKFSRDINNKINELKQLDNFHCLLALLEDLTVVSFAIFLSLNLPNFYAISLILIGSRMRALATLLHESSHRTLADNKALNDLVGYVVGFSILQLPSAYYKSHIQQHHRYLGNIDRDPDFKFHLEEGMYELMSLRRFFLHYIIAPLLLIRVPKTLLYLLRDRFFTPLKSLINVQELSNE